MPTSFHVTDSIPGSPDLSRSSPLGQSRTSSVRPSRSRSSRCSPSHIEHMPRTDAHDTSRAENGALMTSSPGSRPARPSTLSPGPHPFPITPLHSAISEPHISYTADQNVFPEQEVNQRPISRRPGLSPHTGHQVSSPVFFESSELSSFSSRHAAINHSARPRTSNQVFSNISDLASHYGIPQFLPSAPRTTPRRTDIEEASSSQHNLLSSPDFVNLCSNYLTMLSQQPGDNGVNSVPAVGLTPAIEVTDADAVRSLMDVFNATPELQTSNDLNEYLTSPLMDSPFDDDLLATPAIESDLRADVLTSPLIGDFGGNDSFDDFPSLFGGFHDVMYQKPTPQPEPPLVPPRPDLAELYTIETPNTPFFDSPGASSTTVPAKRKSNVTGTRKNITPESLVPVDAPTQTRKYLTPSATSRKELPVTWRRKRLRTVGPGGEEDQLPEEGVTPSLSEQEQIEAKRRQNTIAARRSRKRKLEYQRELEECLERCKQESEMWKQRTMTCMALLRSHHIQCPEFPDS